jgi:hypothetical protein
MDLSRIFYGKDFKFHRVMRKALGLSLIFLLMVEFYLTAQDNFSNGKALNFPVKKFGVSIGNSYELSGIRVNFADRNIKRINGLNVTFWSDHPFEIEKWMNEANYHSVINGISRVC